jgi:hypothetical protein
MAASPPRIERRRPRRGSPERPVNGRLYRGTWLFVALPLLVLAFSLTRPTPLPAPTLPPSFDRVTAYALASDLADRHPDRFPGSPGATGARRWFVERMAQYGFRTRAERFEATIPGRGPVTLTNLVTVAAGCSPQAIVVMAHRDDVGTGAGADDNASGTAALVELARAYARPAGGGGAICGGAGVTPSHTLIFLSTDGGAFGGLGAERFAAESPYAKDVVAVINLDSIAGHGRPRLQLAGDEPRSPAPALVATAAARILEQTGRRPARPSALRQLVDLGFPLSLYEQAPFVGRGIPALTLTSSGDRPPDAFSDTTSRLDERRLGELGRSAQGLLGALDQGLELARGTTSYVYLGPRLIRGWAIQLVLLAMLLPFVVAAIDLFARCRRRRIPIAPAIRSYRSRLAFWLFVACAFELFGLLGAWPDGAARPPAPETVVASRWPALALILFAALVAAGWLVARDRLIPRRPATPTEELAGHTAALLALGVVALLVVSTNVFALVFILPSLHAWLWLAQLRDRAAWARGAVLLAGFAGPLLLLWSFGTRLGLGLDAPWYLAELVALGYVPLAGLAIVVAWAAAAGQLAALATGRYAAYPRPDERTPRGPLRELVRRSVLGVRARRRASSPDRRAFGG